MKRIVLLFLLIYSLVPPLSAQNNNLKDQQIIYLWDVTLSMKGANGSPNIMDIVKEEIINDIKSIDDQSTKIMLLPFQDAGHIFDPVIDFASPTGKKKLIEYISKFNNDVRTNTNIAYPIQYSIDHLIDKNKLNIVKLMTDGVHNDRQTSKEQLYEIIRRWCSYSKDENAFGVYFALTEAANDPDLIAELKNHCWKVVPPGRVDIVELLPNSEFRFNIKDGGDAVLDFTFKGNPTKYNGIQIHAKLADNEYFVVDTDVTLNNGKLSIPVKMNGTYEELHPILSETLYLPMSLSVTSDPDGIKSILLEETVNFIAYNKPEKGLTINPSGKVDFGKVKSYNDFMFCKYTPDTLSQKFTLGWNNDAVKYINYPIRFKLNDGEGRPVPQSLVNLYKNGELCKGNEFTLGTDESDIEIGIVFTDSGEFDSFTWELITDSYQLDKINDMPINEAGEAIMVWKAQHSRGTNPLKAALFILLIVAIGLLVAWFLCMKPIMYPKFKVGMLSLQGPEPFISNLRLKGARKVVLTNKKVSQSRISEIFTGKIIYSINDIWEDATEIEPRDRKSVHVRTPKNSVISSRNVRINEPQVLENLTTRSKTTIKLS